MIQSNMTAVSCRDGSTNAGESAYIHIHVGRLKEAVSIVKQRITGHENTELTATDL